MFCAPVSGVPCESSLKSVRWFLYIHFWNKKKAKPFWRQNDALVRKKAALRGRGGMGTVILLDGLLKVSQVDDTIVSPDGNSYFRILRIKIIFLKKSNIENPHYGILKIHIKVFRFLSSPTKISRHSMWTNSELRWS